VNSEELELSLRTEFESYLKGVLAGMQQDVTDFRKNFEAEFEKHKSQMDEAFRNLTARFESEIKFDPAFTGSVVEHLRLARDDGAQLTAEAFTEAQKLDAPAPAANYDRLRDAINDISNQTSQSTILGSLVDHVANFTARGAFFILKNESFVCWRKFESGRNVGDDSVREIKLPVTADTILADAISSLKAVAGEGHSEDSAFLDMLGYGRPGRMVAVPLIARGRGVAVLYVDSGDDNGPVQLEAIESLVRVAGLTVELRAASAVVTQPAEPPSYVPMQTESAPSQQESPEPVTSPAFESPAVESAPVAENPAFENAPVGSEVVETESTSEFEVYTGAVAVEEPVIEAAPETGELVHEEVSYAEPVAVEEEAPSYAAEVEPVPVEQVNDFAFASNDSYSAPVVVEPQPEEEYSYAGDTANGSANGHAYDVPKPEPLVEVEVATAQPMKSRFSDRNVDLPIEVSDDERRLHNDARRFARLLVSEIKLYNEQKVNEGRDNGDLYDRLREAIDRSREMYDKRVQPQVAAKFDYFHYELVSNLAQGNDSMLGASYPGANV